MDPESQGLLVDLDAAPIEVPHPKAAGFVVQLKPLSDREYLRALAPVISLRGKLNVGTEADLETTMDGLAVLEGKVKIALHRLVIGWRGLRNAKTNEEIPFSPDKIDMLVDVQGFNWSEPFSYTDKETGEEKTGSRPFLFYNTIIAEAANRVGELTSGKA